MAIQYRERPYVRRRIIRYLAANPHITLEDMSRRYHVDGSGCGHNLYFTDGMRIQACKMLQEQQENPPQGEAEAAQVSTQSKDEQQPSAGTSTVRRTRFDFERMLKVHNESCKAAARRPAKKPEPKGLHKEEVVSDNTYRTVYRMTVPGGWLYTITTLESGVATCFVPHPAEVT